VVLEGELDDQAGVVVLADVDALGEPEPLRQVELVRVGQDEVLGEPVDPVVEVQVGHGGAVVVADRDGETAELDVSPAVPSLLARCVPE
jgi:hypothetical protein